MNRWLESEATASGILHEHLDLPLAPTLVLLDGQGVVLFEQLADCTFGRLWGICGQFKFHG